MANNITISHVYHGEKNLYDLTVKWNGLTSGVEYSKFMELRSDLLNGANEKEIKYVFDSTSIQFKNISLPQGINSYGNQGRLFFSTLNASRGETFSLEGARDGLSSIIEPASSSCVLS